MRIFSKLALYLLAISLLMTSCRDEEVNIVRQDLREFSSEQEVLIGQRLVDQIKSDSHNFPIFQAEDARTQEEVTNYLNSLITTAAITTPVQHRNDYQWNVNLIDDDEMIHLFAAPGGNLFIYTGLLKALESEAELLSIIAHEIKYMDEGKPTASLGDEFGGTTMGDLELGYDVTQIGNMALWLRDIAYPENEVIKADAFAMDIICPFKYDTNALYEAILRLSRITDQEVTWLLRRPLPASRMQHLEVMELDCGLNEDNYKERYMEMIGKL